jgi:hypothetical protein
MVQLTGQQRFRYSNQVQWARLECSDNSIETTAVSHASLTSASASAPIALAPSVTARKPQSLPRSSCT